MLLGVAVAAAKMLGVLPAEAAPLVVGVPTVLTDRLPGGGFFTGTTTLLEKMELLDLYASSFWVSRPVEGCRQEWPHLDGTP